MYTFIFLFALITAKKYRTSDDNKTYPLGFNFIIRNRTYHSIKTTDTPKRFDWREKINIPIRNQEQCGSCWAFATVSPIEYQYTYKTGMPLHISEQSLISCNSHRYSCKNGGWWDYDDLMKYGIITSDDFPYDAKDEPCIRTPLFNKIKINTWNYSGTTIEQIKTAIYQYGPIATGVSVDSEFYKYIDGIYDHDSNEPINHAVVLVGWDDDLHAWILRNSWSNRWGSNGYMYIEYGVSGIGYNSVYVTTTIIDNKYIV